MLSDHILCIVFVFHKTFFDIFSSEQYNQSKVVNCLKRKKQYVIFFRAFVNTQNMWNMATKLKVVNELG